MTVIGKRAVINVLKVEAHVKLLGGQHFYLPKITPVSSHLYPNPQSPKYYIGQRVPAEGTTVPPTKHNHMLLN